MEIAWFIIGLAAGAVLAWLALRLKTAVGSAKLEAKLEAAGEKARDFQKLREDTDAGLRQTFEALAAESLRGNNSAFLQLAQQSLETRMTQANADLDLRKQAVEQLVKPLKEKLDSIERERRIAYGGFEQMAKSMASGQQLLARETSNLASALKTPHVRGRWGESTLRRVAELTGMVDRCDFMEQVTLESETGAKRPDMIVYLPNDRQVVVDAKAPLDAYLESLEASTEEGRQVALKRHAKQVRDRYRELAAKSYWSALGHTPEFVVLFLPGEPFMAAALQEDPKLLEDAMSDKVVLASPSTLFSLLCAVGQGWKQEQLAENSRQISQMGREVHDRIADWAGHLEKLRTALVRCVAAFNDSMGSLEGRVLVSARRMKDLGVTSDKEIPGLPPVDLNLRESVLRDGETLGLHFEGNNSAGNQSKIATDDGQ